MIRIDRKLVVACAGGVAFAYAAALALMFLRHQWLLGKNGVPLVTDFLAVWSAGGMVLGGHALAAYNPVALHAAEAAAAGGNFAGQLAWPYPPSYLFVAAALALIGFAPALLVWGALTGASYAAATALIARTRAAAVLALAAPWTLASFMIGQNGFLTAALIGGALVTLEKRPVMAGVLFGLLSYKPQFGILIPFALVAGAHWRCFASAAATVVVVNAAALAVFGPDTLAAFFQVLPQTADALVSRGAVGFGKLSNLYGMMRWLGAPAAAGWTMQILLALTLAAAIVWLWRSRAPYALKAAGLAVAILLATPYVFFYDLPVLAIALAFLYRHRAFNRFEMMALAAALLALVGFIFITAPFGLLAAAIVAGLVIWRLRSAEQPGASRNT
jgi:arabinofuranan 3-O-arabinosyltransferase